MGYGEYYVMSVNVLTSHSQSVNQVGKIKINCVGLYYWTIKKKTADMSVVWA